MNKRTPKGSPALVGAAGMMALAAVILTPAAGVAQQSPVFYPGNVVVAVEGCGVYAGTCVGSRTGQAPAQAIALRPVTETTRQFLLPCSSSLQSAPQASSL